MERRSLPFSRTILRVLGVKISQILRCMRPPCLSCAMPESLNPYGEGGEDGNEKRGLVAVLRCKPSGKSVHSLCVINFLASALSHATSQLAWTPDQKTPIAIGLKVNTIMSQLLNSTLSTHQPPVITSHLPLAVCSQMNLNCAYALDARDRLLSKESKLCLCFGCSCAPMAAFSCRAG